MSDRADAVATLPTSARPAGPATAQRGAPTAGGFSVALSEAVSTYSRKAGQSAFLRGAAVGQTVAPGTPVDDSQRRLVRSNAVAGVTLPAAPPPAPAPAVTAWDRPAAAPAPVQPAPPVVPAAPASDAGSFGRMAIADFPRPAGDNGRGIHWIPTLRSSPEVVDRFVQAAVDMDMKWVVILNDNAAIGDNDYLVRRLVDSGIMPIVRVFTDGLQPISGDLEAMVRHYRSLGVTYFKLYNEPNLMVETKGQPPDVEGYLDLWVPAAKQVIAAGGLPGIGGFSPNGEMDDRQYLEQMLDSLGRRGELSLLDRSWLAVHNYTGPRPMSDPDGFLRFRQYDAIIREKLGHSLPMVGAEGGTHVGPGVDERTQVDMMLGAYDYMATSAEPYMFAYTYWIIANEAGGGRDPEFSHHALYREDGPTALARALTRRA